MGGRWVMSDKSSGGSPQWIPATKWLPLGPHHVLVSDYEIVTIGSWDGEGWIDYNDEPFDSVITHWMELPDHPDEDGGEA